MATHEPGTIAFVAIGQIERSELPGLIAQVCASLERNGAVVVICDVGGASADAVTVDALARLQLAARRKDCEVRLRNPSTELCALIALMGLEEVLQEQRSELRDDG